MDESAATTRQPTPDATDAAKPVDVAHATADALFAEHATVFGGDLDPYRGHVQRIVGLVALQGPIPAELARPLGVAAFFHDAGIWFDHTWNYLPTSIERALAALDPDDTHAAAAVRAMIDEHHRVRSARSTEPLVEAFRRADMADVYHPLGQAPGVAYADYQDLVRRYPYAGFRRMLARAFLRGLRENPLHPMPMVKF